MTEARHDGAPMVETTAFEAWQLLGRAVVARVAWQAADGISVVPVSCVVADGALWFRTTSTSSLARVGAGLEVAVEADELDPATGSGWSVVLRAVVELVDPDDSPDVVGELRTWPRGPHHVYVRLEPTAVSGRRLLAGA